MRIEDLRNALVAAPVVDYHHEYRTLAIGQNTRDALLAKLDLLAETVQVLESGHRMSNDLCDRLTEGETA